MATHEHIIGPKRRRSVANLGRVPVSIGYTDEQGALHVLLRLEPGEEAPLPERYLSAWSDGERVMLRYTEHG